MSAPDSALSARLAGRTKRRRPLISLTPLVDVVFILLVFFMLASSFLDWRSVELNTPAQGTGVSTMEGAVLVEIRPEGLRLSRESLSLDGLAARIGERLADNPDQRVLVKPASGVALQPVVDVIDRLAQIGAVNLSLIRDFDR